MHGQGWQVAARRLLLAPAASTLHNLAVRITGLFDPDTANGYYRAALPLSALRARGHAVTMHHGGSVLDSSYELPRSDAVFIHRGCYPEHLALVRDCAERSIGVVWDNDDDLSALPKSTRAQNRHSKRASREFFKRSVTIAQAASVMTTSSEEIARIYRELGASPVQVIENQVAAPSVAARPRGRALVIGYTGAMEHADDLKKLKFAATIERLVSEQQHVTFVSVGIDLGIRSPRYRCHGFVPFRELAAIVGGFDIGVAPLLDSPFNRSRSDIKVKEYAAAGATWLASPVGPYRALGAAEGGQLIADRDWHAALTQLVEDDAVRARLTRQARAWARRQTIRTTAARWEAILKSAVSAAAAR
jgi:glycosyltransferase involved in cell wall biosynthesis